MKKEVRYAMEKQFNLIGLQESTMKTRRKTCGGAKTAIITTTSGGSIQTVDSRKSKNRLGNVSS